MLLPQDLMHSDLVFDLCAGTIIRKKNVIRRQRYYLLGNLKGKLYNCVMHTLLLLCLDTLYDKLDPTELHLSCDQLPFYRAMSVMYVYMLLLRYK